MPTVDELRADAVAERAFILGLLPAGLCSMRRPGQWELEAPAGAGTATFISPWSGRRYRVELRREAAEGEGG